MSLSFLVAAVATIAAAVGAGLLARECARLPRIEVVPWLVAAAGLTLALAAQAAGYSGGFGPTTFRVVQLGAQLLAPLALTWGLAEVTGRSVAARFTARLVLAAAAIIAGVILATDPLSSAPFTRGWPAASAHYQIIPNGVLALVAVGTVITAIVAVVVAGVRSRSEPAWQEAFMVAAAGGGGVVAVQLLRLSLPVSAAYAVVCLAAAALAWFAGTRSDVQRLRAPAGRAAARGRYPDEDEYGGLYRPDDTGYRYRDDTGYGELRADTGYGPDGADTGFGTYGGQDISDTGYGFYRDDTGGLRAISDTGYGLYRDDTGSMVFSDGPGGGAFPPGDIGLPGLAGDEEEGTARLYGQIAIYTLLDGRAEEFDELAQDVVAKVKAREPETLVFVMHGVPSAPMQRILYEVYRDQAAYEHHMEQAYVREFEERRKAFVLATNVIELGVRQAKVSPLAPGAAAPAVPDGAVPAPPPAQPSRSRSQVPPESPRSYGPAGGSRPPRGAGDPAGPYGGTDPSQPPRAAEPARSRPAAEPLRPARGGAEPEPARSRPAPGPLRSRPPAEPSRSRQAPEPGRSRPAPEPPSADESDFWSRRPADPPDDDDYGDYWRPGSRYR